MSIVLMIGAPAVTEFNGPFNAICFNDHLFEVLRGTELEEKCRQLEDGGRLSAFVLGPDACPRCLLEATERDRAFAEACSLTGCPFNDPCQKECMAERNAQRVSPYDDQLRWFRDTVPGVTLNGQPVDRDHF